MASYLGGMEKKKPVHSPHSLANGTAPTTLQTLLDHGEYDAFRNTHIFESNFLQVTNKGEYVDISNHPNLITMGILTSNTRLGVPNHLVISQDQEIKRMIPLEMVDIFVHNLHQRRLKVRLISGKIYYLQLYSPGKNEVSLFERWIQLLSLLKSRKCTVTTPLMSPPSNKEPNLTPTAQKHVRKEMKEKYKQTNYTSNLKTPRSECLTETTSPISEGNISVEKPRVSFAGGPPLIVKKNATQQFVYGLGPKMVPSSPPRSERIDQTVHSRSLVQIPKRGHSHSKKNHDKGSQVRRPSSHGERDHSATQNKPRKKGQTESMVTPSRVSLASTGRYLSLEVWNKEEVAGIGDRPGSSQLSQRSKSSKSSRTRTASTTPQKSGKERSGKSRLSTELEYSASQKSTRASSDSARPLTKLQKSQKSRSLVQIPKRGHSHSKRNHDRGSQVRRPSSHGESDHSATQNLPRKKRQSESMVTPPSRVSVASTGHRYQSLEAWNKEEVAGIGDRPGSSQQSQRSKPSRTQTASVTSQKLGTEGRGRSQASSSLSPELEYSASQKSTRASSESDHPIIKLQKSQKSSSLVQIPKRGHSHGKKNQDTGSQVRRPSSHGERDRSATQNIPRKEGQSESMVTPSRVSVASTGRRYHSLEVWNKEEVAGIGDRPGSSQQSQRSKSSKSSRTRTASVTSQKPGKERRGRSQDFSRLSPELEYSACLKNTRASIESQHPIIKLQKSQKLRSLVQTQEKSSGLQLPRKTESETLKHYGRIGNDRSTEVVSREQRGHQSRTLTPDKEPLGAQKNELREELISDSSSEDRRSSLTFVTIYSALSSSLERLTESKRKADSKVHSLENSMKVTPKSTKHVKTGALEANVTKENLGSSTGARMSRQADLSRPGNLIIRREMNVESGVTHEMTRRREEGQSSAQERKSKTKQQPRSRLPRSKTSEKPSTSRGAPKKGEVVSDVPRSKKFISAGPSVEMNILQMNMFSKTAGQSKLGSIIRPSPQDRRLFKPGGWIDYVERREKKPDKRPLCTF